MSRQTGFLFSSSLFWGRTMSTQRFALMGLAILFVVVASYGSKLYATARFPNWVGFMETEVTLNQDKALQGNVTPSDETGFPITITKPGRYVLTSNLYPKLNNDGIEIKAHDVTVDFNGFRLHGGGEARNGIVGDYADTATIMNGVIAGFKDHAIRGRNFWVIENMRVLANGRGISLLDFARVQRNTITINQDTGIRCIEDCHVESNLISSNWGGVAIGSGTVLGNTITRNKTLGIWSMGSNIGFGNNTLAFNNVDSGVLQGEHSDAQVQPGGLRPLHPNVCSPTWFC